MANERITEEIVRNHLKADPIYHIIKFEEQKSSHKRVNELLKNASKSGAGIGKPEFIITFPKSNIDYLIIIECKASIEKHLSKLLNKPNEYAVDGVIHYGKYLSKEFDVIAIAVSGQNKKEFLFKKGSENYIEKKHDKKLLTIESYLKIFEDEQEFSDIKIEDIIKIAVELNEEYHAYSIVELTRCTIVSAMLLSLQYKAFNKGYKEYETVKELAEAMIQAIKGVLTKHKVRNKTVMLEEFRKILNEPIFRYDEIKHKNKQKREKSIMVIKEMIFFLEQKIFPYIKNEGNGFDILGRFYTEFIRYAGSEQRQGLVLTPSHITELFCELANINEDSVIYDPCCGTGGFLIAGMKNLFSLAGSNTTKIKKIKNDQIIGVELRPSMFTYACTNMMMRGDGKSNIYCGNCFILKDEIIKNHKPTIAFLNPPYDVKPVGQMEFIEHALDVVSPQNGMVVAIVQMSCAIKNQKELIAIKERILSKHKLKAVLSMPDDLFYPIGVVTCIMVFEANKKNEGKTWFGYFKDDGFEKRKYKGRIDARKKWLDIKKSWIKAYNNLDEIAGFSVKHEVTSSDEWCAEAYLETDYFNLSEHDFLIKMRDYAAFLIKSGLDQNEN